MNFASTSRATFVRGCVPLKALEGLAAIHYGDERSLDLIDVTHRKSVWWLPDAPFELGREAHAGQSQPHLVVVPFQGWQEDVWFDGPLLHYYKGKLIEYVSWGGPAYLTIDLDEDWDQVPEVDWDISDDHSIRTSLAYGLRQRIGPADHIEYVPKVMQAIDILNLVILRMAYPRAKIHLREPTGFRRLVQNLGIYLSPCKPSAHAIELAEPWLQTWIPKEAFASIAGAINFLSPVIPEKISRQITLGDMAKTPLPTSKRMSRLQKYPGLACDPRPSTSSKMP